MKRFHHGFLVDSQYSAIRHPQRQNTYERLASKRSFAEKSPSLNMPMVASLPIFETHGQFHFTRLHIKHRIGGIPLRKNSLFAPECSNCFLPIADGCEKGMGIEIGLLPGRQPWN